MPSYTRGKLRDQLVFVRPRADSSLFYGWKTKDLGSISGISEAELREQLGHVKASELNSVPGVLRANAPKPARVKKTVNRNAAATAQVSISTFCDATKLKTALSEGWTIGKNGLGVSVSRSARSETCVVEVDGVLYAYPMNKADFEAYKALIGAKDTLTDADLKRMVRGSSNPRPPKMGLQISTGDVVSSFSCYVSEDKVSSLLSDGWQLLDDGTPTIA